MRIAHLPGQKSKQKIPGAIPCSTHTKAEEKNTAYFQSFCEWAAARKQLKLENMYNPELGIYLRQKLRINQQFNSLNVYDNIGATSGASLEKILEWNGSLDEFSIELSPHFQLFSGNNPNSIEKELLRSAKTHFGSKKHRDMMKLLDQPLLGDISGI